MAMGLLAADRCAPSCFHCRPLCWHSSNGGAAPGDRGRAGRRRGAGWGMPTAYCLSRGKGAKASGMWE